MRFAISVAALITLCSTTSWIVKSEDAPEGCGGFPVFGQSFDNVSPPALVLHSAKYLQTNAIDPDGIFWVYVRILEILHLLLIHFSKCRICQ